MSNDSEDSNKNPGPKKVNVDTGLKVALGSIGIQQVPDAVSEEEYEKLSGKVSQGVRLRMAQKAKEQNMVMMWKSRVNLVKQARQLMIQKSFSDAAVSYEKYLKVLELVYDIKPGQLSPEIFNKSSRSKELTVVASVYWDLVRIYDTSAVYGERMARAANKLAEFLPYSTVFPQISKAAIGFQKSAKNPQVIRRLLKSIKAGKKGCFIATCIYQDPYHPDVQALRQFRDEKLCQHWYGRSFIWTYYRFSPQIAYWLSKKPVLRKGLKFPLSHLVHWIKH